MWPYEWGFSLRLLISGASARLLVYRYIFENQDSNCLFQIYKIHKREGVYVIYNMY